MSTKVISNSFSSGDVNTTFEVKISASKGGPLTTWLLCATRVVPGNVESFAFHCNEQVTGSVIKIQALKTAILAACEIMVYGQITCKYYNLKVQ